MDIRTRMHSDLCNNIHEMFVKKNKDYGNAYTKFREKYPTAILMHLNEKVSRLDTLMTSGAKPNVANESIEDTLMDIANYALMEIVERRISAEKVTARRTTPINGAAKQDDPKASDHINKAKDKTSSSDAAFEELKRLLDELDTEEKKKKHQTDVAEEVEDFLGALLTLSILADMMRGD